MREGEIRVAIEKERLVRSKHVTGYSGLEDVAEYCLRFEGITIDDVEHIVVNDNTHRIDKTVYSPREMRIGHHLAHAWAAVGLSGWQSAAVLVVDGEGSYIQELSPEERAVCNASESHYLEKESAYFFHDGQLVPLKKWVSARGNGMGAGTDGMGATYWYLSQLMFGRDYQDSKVMGLAAYRRPNDVFAGVLTPASEGDVVISPDWIFRAANPPPQDLDASFERYAELAATVQAELEAALVHKARWLRDVSGARRLCYGGGVALNCVANTKLHLSGLFEEVFVPFGAADSGNAIGCAYFGSRMLGEARTQPARRTKAHASGMPSPYLGQTYQDAEVCSVLERYRAADLIERPQPLDTAAISAALAAGEVVGWFQGRSEFGPRALGNRSLLADPRDRDVRSRLNHKVKYREAYRPFAPAVLAEHAGEWFEDIVPFSQYMQFTARIRPDKRELLPAVRHEDDSARIQLVEREANPAFHRLISEFHRLSGVPVLLNTSFNINEPIVETPADAAKTFVCSGIDRLVMQSFMVTRNSQLLGDPDSVANADHVRLVWHADVEFVSHVGRNWFALQPLSDLEAIWHEGCWFRKFRFDAVQISERLFASLSDLRPEPHAIYQGREISQLMSTPALRMELFSKLHAARFLSMLYCGPA